MYQYLTLLANPEITDGSTEYQTLVEGETSWRTLQDALTHHGKIGFRVVSATPISDNLLVIMERELPESP